MQFVFSLSLSERGMKFANLMLSAAIATFLIFLNTDLAVTACLQKEPSDKQKYGNSDKY
jgi:hypothetical protein